MLPISNPPRFAGLLNVSTSNPRIKATLTSTELQKGLAQIAATHDVYIGKQNVIVDNQIFERFAANGEVTTMKGPEQSRVEFRTYGKTLTDTDGPYEDEDAAQKAYVDIIKLLRQSVGTAYAA